MEKGIHYIENVFEYNDLLGVETLHPLVSVIDLSKAHPMKQKNCTALSMFQNLFLPLVFIWSLLSKLHQSFHIA